jgi:hypothetical protein
MRTSITRVTPERWPLTASLAIQTESAGSSAIDLGRRDRRCGERRWGTRPAGGGHPTPGGRGTFG